MFALNIEAPQEMQPVMLHDQLSNLVGQTKMHRMGQSAAQFNRLLFDGFIGYGKTHGIPADIDLIMDSKNLHEILFLEIKEKDLSKRAPKGFGMDVDRIKSIRTLSLMTGTQVYYIVRQVNNQKERLFIKWRYINMFNFVSCLDDAVIEGGGWDGV
jgi:hypothetical protein